MIRITQCVAAIVLLTGVASAQDAHVERCRRLGEFSEQLRKLKAPHVDRIENNRARHWEPIVNEETAEMAALERQYPGIWERQQRESERAGAQVEASTEAQVEATMAEQQRIMADVAAGKMTPEAAQKRLSEMIAQLQDGHAQGVQELRGSIDPEYLEFQKKQEAISRKYIPRKEAARKLADQETTADFEAIRRIEASYPHMNEVQEYDDDCRGV